MQITIDTERDDLDQVARVVDALRGEPMGVRASATVNFKGRDYTYTNDKELHTSDPVQQLAEDAERDTLTVEGVKPEEVLDPAAVFGNVKGASLFDAEPGKPSTQAEEAAAATESAETGGTAGTSGATGGTAGELDAAGTPWDERIHASTKTKVADGTWKKKRGVDQELYNEVMEEISGDPKPAADGQTESVAQPAETVAPPAPAVVQPGAATPPPPPPPVAPPAPPVGELNFASFVRMVTDKANNVSAAAIAEACQAEGVASFPLLQQQPDKIPAVAKRLGLA